MNKDDMILISVDDHIIEPPNMFKNHLPAKYRDEAPGSCTTRTGPTRGSSATP